MIFEKHLRSVSRAASQRLGMLRKSWRVFHDRSLLGRCFRSFVPPVLELQCGARLQIHTLNYWTVQSVVPGFYLGVCLSVTLFIVDPWQYCVCSIRSSATRCTLLMVLFLDRICQCGLHAVLWSHIGILMRASLQNLAAPQDFYSPLSVPLERSCYPRIRSCGTDGF